MIPIVTLTGKAGSGKSTVASILADRYKNVVPIAFADPVKRLAKAMFDFTNEQLWGSSHLRYIPENRYNGTLGSPEHSKAWDSIYRRIDTKEFYSLASDIFEKKSDLFIAKIQTTFLQDLKYNFSPISPRVVLQQLGTGLVRSESEDFWLNYGKKTAFKLVSGKYKYTPTGGLEESRNTNNPSFVVITDARFINEVMGMASAGASIWKIQKKYELTEDTHSSENDLDLVNPRIFDYIINNDYSEAVLENKVMSIFGQVLGEGARIF